MKFCGRDARELNCWEITQCGRDRGGENIDTFGPCIVSQEGFGHKCWNVAGTLCNGKIQGTVVEKQQNCSICIVRHMAMLAEDNRKRDAGRKQYHEGTGVICLEPDMAQVFKDSNAVNAALRKTIEQEKK